MTTDPTTAGTPPGPAADHPAPLRWPDGARSCAALAFDLDGPTAAALQGDRIWDSPRRFLDGAYGPTCGLPRLLRLLADHQLHATFFVPAWIVETWPDACREIVAAGHEVAGHGDRHENFFDLDVQTQERVLARSQQVFADVLGSPATGFRAPSGDWHPDTPRLLVAHGYTWSSSLRADHLPYMHRRLDLGDTLVEIPARVDLDDYAYLAFSEEPAFPPGGDRIAAYDDVVANWRREFDGHHAIGGCFTTVWHPKVSGTPGRARVLGELLGHMAATPDVWFATGHQVAELVRGQQAGVA